MANNCLRQKQKPPLQRTDQITPEVAERQGGCPREGKWGRGSGRPGQPRGWLTKAFRFLLSCFSTVLLVAGGEKKEGWMPTCFTCPCST